MQKLGYWFIMSDNLENPKSISFWKKFWTTLAKKEIVLLEAIEWCLSHQSKP